MFKMEDEVKDLQRQLNFILANTEELNQGTKDYVKLLSINYILDLHKHLKENDLKTYKKLLKEVTEE